MKCNENKINIILKNEYDEKNVTKNFKNDKQEKN